MNNKEVTYMSVDELVYLIVSKDKRGFGRCKKELKRECKKFSPFYREFIYKILMNKSLKVNRCYSNSHVVISGSANNKYTRKVENKIFIDLNQEDSLPHELGHAIDNHFGCYLPFSSTVILTNGKTLREVFMEEFDANHEKLYQLMMDELKHLLTANINEQAYDIFVNNLPLYRKLRRTEYKQKEERKALQDSLYESGFVEVYYQYVTKKCYAVLMQKYAPIIDALSSKYDLSYFQVSCHDVEYYKESLCGPVSEFFANTFCDKVTSEHLRIDYLIEYLPKTVEAFEELFDIIYDHIMNNKRFTDVKNKGAIL